MSKCISCVLNGLSGGVSLLNQETIEMNSRMTKGSIDLSASLPCDAYNANAIFDLLESASFFLFWGHSTFV